MPATAETYQFGRLKLQPRRRALLADDVPVVLTARAYDMLELLVRCRDRVLTRDEIVSHVWQGLAVGENNLTVQMSTLRRVLAEHSGGAPLITTVPGRGYQFVGLVTETFAAAEPQAASAAADRVAPPAPAPDDAARAAGRRVTLRPRFAMPGLVMAALILAALAVLWRGAHPGPPRLSIAVLPFRNPTGDHAQDYLANALTDDLTTDLAHLPGSVVIARESAAAFKGRQAPEIGRLLNVRYLVGGSLRVDEGMCHINAELIDAATGTQLWADHFDTPRAQVSAAQDVMVRRMATALDFQLGQLVSARSLRDRPDDPDALDLFFRARAIEDRDDSLAGLEQAQALLEQAVAQQKDFGDALAELGSLLLHKVRDMDDPHDAEDYAEAQRVIARALQVSPRNAHALADQARAYLIEGKWVQAAYSARAALAVEPSNVAALGVLATSAQSQGHLAEAVPYLEAIFRLLPDSPANKPRYATLGYIRLLQGQTAEALDLLNRAIAGDRDPKPGDETMGRAEFTRLLIVAATELQGDGKRARQLYDEAKAVWPNRTVWRFAGYLPKSAATLPGYGRMLAALHDAGMPWTAGELDGTTSMGAVCTDDDFGSTPPGLAGAATVTTAQLASRLAAPKPPIVIDTGRGQAALPGATLWLTEGPDEPVRKFVDREMTARAGGDLDAPVVLAGDGPFGCAAYEAAEYLVAKGYRHVAWYRGGEESWAASGHPSTDLRP